MHFSRKKYHLLLTTLLVSFCLNTTAQVSVWDKPKDNTKEALKKVDKRKKKLKQLKKHIADWGLLEEYTKQLSIGGQMNSNGWTGGLYYMKVVDAGKKNVFSLRFSEIKHDKQIKQQDENIYPELGRPEPYVFGKINNLYTIQIGLGREQVLLPNVVEGNISVGIRLSGGFSLAMLKPYYLKLIYVDNTLQNPVPELKEETYTDNTAYAFLKNGNKLASSSWTKGLKEMQYVPGAFAEAAFVIEPKASSWFVQTITIGGNIAFYSKELPIMAEISAYNYKASLFVGLAFGKRW